MFWKHFNVHWQDTHGRKGKTTLTAFNKEDAKNAAESLMKQRGHSYSLPFGGGVIKVTGPLGIHIVTPKQKLGRKYGFIIGSIKGADIQFRQSFEYMQTSDPRILRAREIVNNQFARLQRDLRECFRIAGLKVK